MKLKEHKQVFSKIKVQKVKKTFQMKLCYTENKK